MAFLICSTLNVTCLQCKTMSIRIRIFECDCLLSQANMLVEMSQLYGIRPLSACLSRFSFQ